MTVSSEKNGMKQNYLLQLLFVFGNILTKTTLIFPTSLRYAEIVVLLFNNSFYTIQLSNLNVSK